MAAKLGTVIALIQAMAPKVSPEVIEQAVSDWLDDHPEATTTVEDGSISYEKLNQVLKAKSDVVDGIGDKTNLTTDNKETIISAINEIAAQVYDVISSGGGEAENLYDDASEEMMLSISSTSFGTDENAYGFYVPVEDCQGKNLIIKRTNRGYVLRGVFTVNEPVSGGTFPENYRFQSRDNMCIVVNVPYNANYMYIMFYNSEYDTYTKAQCLEGMEIKEADISDENIYDDASEEMMMSFSMGTFAQSESLYGFYIPVDAQNEIISIKRTNKGNRFRFAFTKLVPAIGVSYYNYESVDGNSSRADFIIPEDVNYLYIAFYSSSQDTLTKEQCLEGMNIRYANISEGHSNTNVPKNVHNKQGSINAGKVLSVNVDGEVRPSMILDAVDGVKFENKKINASGEVVDDEKTILSGFIQTFGRFGVSCPSEYSLTVYLYNSSGVFVSSATITNKTKYYTNVGYVRISITASDNSDITPDSVNFSKIKMPKNRISVVGYAKEKTFTLDAENSISSDVYAYLDEVVNTHGLYASKTLLCTETSGLPVYYYTLGSGAKKICIVSGQHGPGEDGDPRDSVITVAKMAHDLIDGNFADNSFLKTLHDEYTILLIPILNVYGFNNCKRTDANNVDTNRDWVSGSTIQVAAAKPLITNFDPFMILDVHCNGTTPISNVDIEIQFALGSTYNPLFKSEVQSMFKSYYNTDVQTRQFNAETTLSYYIVETLGKLGGLYELRWWLKNKKWLHDYQVESCNYAMIINAIKYFAAVNESETFVYEHTPNQNQY
jgi:hypothetical protein